MQRIDTVAELRAWRAGRATVAMVPTMGALHEGHLTHIDLARRHANHVLVSVFVNPTQFGPHEDFDRYPRTLEADLAACEARGASAVFCPAVEEVYPPQVPDVAIDVPGVSAGLEGKQRPGHFNGVCRVVAKLLNMARPDFATFGRKDLQQLRVLQALIADLAMPIRVIEVPTVREGDGVAMSSRNRYLTEAGRAQARVISRSLRACRETVATRGHADVDDLETALRRTMTDAGLEVDYAVIRREPWLEGIDVVSVDGPAAVAVIAARVEGVRLLDNLLLNRRDPTDGPG